MDSGSSGSIQSSASGGDDEYDSRAAEGISGFLNDPPPRAGPMANPPPLQPAVAQLQRHHLQSSSTMFDPFSNFFDPLPTRPHQNSFINLDTLWPRNPRPDQNPTELAGLVPAASTQSQPLMGSQLQVCNQVSESNGPRGLTLTDPSEVVANNGNNGVRNPRKRTRASRRAPTTVLTTDTSNFRAMVQEFTGIPAPPFTPSSFPRPRLNLFGTSSSSPPYLLRPFPQKLLPFSSPATTSVLSSSSDYLLPKQNLPTMNSILNLQPPSLQQNSDRNLQTGLLEEFGLRQNHAGARLGGDNGGDILPTSWGIGGPAPDEALLRSVNGKYGNAKVNFSASSSDFHGDKRSENVTTRSEGMLESWICSSD